MSYYVINVWHGSNELDIFTTMATCKFESHATEIADALHEYTTKKHQTWRNIYTIAAESEEKAIEIAHVKHYGL